MYRARCKKHLLVAVWTAALSCPIFYMNIFSAGPATASRCSAASDVMFPIAVLVTRHDQCVSCHYRILRCHTPRLVSTIHVGTVLQQSRDLQRSAEAGSKRDSHSRDRTCRRWPHRHARRRISCALLPTTTCPRPCSFCVPVSACKRLALRRATYDAV